MREERDLIEGIVEFGFEVEDEVFVVEERVDVVDAIVGKRHAYLLYLFEQRRLS